MNVIRPKFIALDSSHLANLADDAGGLNHARRKTATEFMELFGGSGGILLLCWHHFEELLQHGDSGLVARRIAFIQSLPMVAWIAPVTEDGAPGSIMDILAFEVSEAFKEPDAGAVAIRDRVARRIFCCGPGRAAIGPYVMALDEVREEFQRRAARSREIVAVSQSGYIDIGKAKVADWLKGTWRSPQEAEQRIAHMTQTLADDIRQRGDKRIPDATIVATEFMATMRAAAGVPKGTTCVPSPDKLLPDDVDQSDIGADTTFDEMGYLAVWRRRLRLVNDLLGLPWLELKARATEARLPSGLVQSVLRRHWQDLPERKGSELIDRYLLSLAPYAHITYVDKRTHVAVSGARKASREFAAIIRRVEKAGAYSQIASQVAS